MFFERVLGGIVGVLAVVMIVLPGFMLALAIPYAILRMRDARGGRPDPQLGFKVAMNYFFSLALVKPSLALPFLILPLVRGRWRALAVVAAVHLGATCLLALRVGCPPWDLLRQWH